MTKIYFVLFLIFSLGVSLGTYSLAFADGCYICGSGSTNSCKDYCRYVGSDTFDNRKKCEDKGCKVSGTASCPVAANYKVCKLRTEEKEPIFAINQ